MEKRKFCHSCGHPTYKETNDIYCNYCTDENGKLLSADEVKTRLAEWFKKWQPNVTDEKALERAALYIKAMPAWADK